jgi:hypothetical protein
MNAKPPKRQEKKDAKRREIDSYFLSLAFYLGVLATWRSISFSDGKRFSFSPISRPCQAQPKMPENPAVFQAPADAAAV